MLVPTIIRMRPTIRYKKTSEFDPPPHPVPTQVNPLPELALYYGSRPSGRRRW